MSRRRKIAAAAIAAVGLTAIATTAQASPGALDKLAQTQIVRVETPTQADRAKLAGLNLDLTEAGGKDYVEVVLRGAKDAQTLRKNGFKWDVRVDDLAKRAQERQAADKRYAAKAAGELPSGSTEYRDLEDYTAELKGLAESYPEHAKVVELPHPSLEGRTVTGLEISSDVAADDGKPRMAMFGLHHAREWPSGELTLEFAHDLLKNAESNERISGLLDEVRLISVPVVNPDGFSLSRGGPLREYKRKNCRVIDGQEPVAGECALGAEPIDISQLETGVDVNRNYGGNWGGPGASAIPLQMTYRGAGPFSEPESQNVRELVSTEQVTTLITNHTYSNLVLRPPGLAGAPDTPDEGIYKKLGDSMAAQNGYTSQKSYELYDTTGTTEDWSYFATGGLGFTFEIGPDEFHPAYEKLADYYYGSGEHEGKGNREAWLLALENAADEAHHSVISGSAPEGRILRLHKEFQTKNHDGSEFTDKLDTTMTVPEGDAYEWHTNPSTRPLVGQDGKTEAWKLTCELPDGKVLQTEEVTVDRGEQVKVDLDECETT